MMLMLFNGSVVVSIGEIDWVTEKRDFILIPMYNQMPIKKILVPQEIQVMETRYL
jgi:hypothetical protein